MSLRDSYFNGVTGLQQQMDAAFQAGIAYVGSGTEDISVASVRSKADGFIQGPGRSGLYFMISSPTANYAIWYAVSGEIAPSVHGNAVLVRVDIVAGDGGDDQISVASKTSIAINAINGKPFSTSLSGENVTITCNAPGQVLAEIDSGSVGDYIACLTVQEGAGSTGNYTTINNALLSAAQQGLTDFLVTVQGTGTMNGGYLRQNNGNNLLVKSFFAGITYALASEEIYSYQCRLSLDVSDRTNTNVIFTFSFSNSTVSYNGGPTSPINASTTGVVVPTTTPTWYNVNY